MIKLVEYFAWLNLIVAALGFGFVKQLAQSFNTPVVSCLLMLGILTAVSLAMIYTCRQKISATDIGIKAYPAVLVSYLLFALICYRWLLS